MAVAALRAQAAQAGHWAQAVTVVPLPQLRLMAVLAVAAMAGGHRERSLPPHPARLAATITAAVVVALVALAG